MLAYLINWKKASQLGPFQIAERETQIVASLKDKKPFSVIVVRGGGPVVTLDSFYLGHPSLNPIQVLGADDINKFLNSVAKLPLLK